MTEDLVLQSNSSLYEQNVLWTFGFLYTLLEYSSQVLDSNQNTEMIHFEKKISLRVEPCRVEKVLCLITKMKKDDLARVLGKAQALGILTEVNLHLNPVKLETP